MEYKGSFRDRHERVVTVEIVTGGQRVPSREIGTEAAGVWFAEDPVEIRSEVNDTFDHLLRSSATVRLLTRDWPEWVTESGRLGVTVRVTRGGVCLFAGYVEPEAYSQGYDEELEEVELGCIDCLGALQYRRYGGVGMPGVVYEAVKAGAEVRSLYDIISGAVGPLARGVSESPVCLYDGSRRRTSSVVSRSILRQVGVSELLMLGETEDDVWTLEETVEEALRYLNLHMVQRGDRFYVFAWESLKGGREIAWQDLAGLGMPNTIVERTGGGEPVVIGTGMVTDCDTEISVSEVYNQLALTCDIAGVESVVENPLEASALTTTYDSRQLYMTEYSADGDGETAQRAMWDMLHGGMTTYGKAFVRDWYIWVKQHPRWRFRLIDDAGLSEDVASGRRQHRVAWAQEYAVGSPRGAWLMAVGSSERPKAGDNSPAPRPELSDYLVMGVCGHGYSSTDRTWPSEGDLRGHAPYAEYTGRVSGTAWSPVDEGVSNYIVISGSFLAKGYELTTGQYGSLMGIDAGSWWTSEKVRAVPGGDGRRFYVQQFHSAERPGDEPVTAPDSRGIAFTPHGEGMLKYYRIDRLETDTISRVPLVRCMLVVGDKCVVESGTDGSVGSYEWRPYKERARCSGDDEYYAQSFCIGFDPKQGDWLMGEEHGVQNNITREMGIEAEGTAIRIRKGDAVSGAVTFRILYPTDFNIMDLSTGSAPGWGDFGEGNGMMRWLPRVKFLMIKGLEVKVYSDNGGVSLLQDNDVVYMTDTKGDWVGRKDDITFRINSALTREERRRMGVSDTVKLSAAVDMETGLPLTAVYDAIGGRQVKPEELYIDCHYREWSVPRIVMEQSLDDTGGNVDPWGRYRHPGMSGRVFFVQGVSRGLREATARVTLKESNM